MKKLILESFYFAKSNFASIFGIIGPFILITSVISPILDNGYEYSWIYFLYFFMFFLAHTYYMCRLIKLMASIVSGAEYNLSVLPSEWFRLLVVYIIHGVAVLAGFVALIIPGLYLMARYSFADFESVLNGKQSFKALGSSWQKTKDITQKLIIAIVLIYGGQILLTSALSYIGDESLVVKMAIGIVSELIISTSMLFLFIVYFRMYAQNSKIGSDPVETKA